MRASAAILPSLALSVADELAEQVAEIKALKERQRFSGSRFWLDKPRRL